MIWPEVGNIIVVARRGEYNGCGQKRVIQRMWPEDGSINDWPEVGNIIVVARRGEYNGCGQKRVIQRDVARRGGHK